SVYASSHFRKSSSKNSPYEFSPSRVNISVNIWLVVDKTVAFDWNAFCIAIKFTNSFDSLTLLPSSVLPTTVPAPPEEGANNFGAPDPSVWEYSLLPTLASWVGALKTAS